MNQRIYDMYDEIKKQREAQKYYSKEIRNLSSKSKNWEKKTKK